jgi:hypothetical protein
MEELSLEEKAKLYDEAMLVSMALGTRNGRGR